MSSVLATRQPTYDAAGTPVRALLEPSTRVYRLTLETQLSAPHIYVPRRCRLEQWARITVGGMDDMYVLP